MLCTSVCLCWCMMRTCMYVRVRTVSVRMRACVSMFVFQRPDWTAATAAAPGSRGPRPRVVPTTFSTVFSSRASCPRASWRHGPSSGHCERWCACVCACVRVCALACVCVQRKKHAMCSTLQTATHSPTHVLRPIPVTHATHLDRALSMSAPMVVMWGRNTEKESLFMLWGRSGQGRSGGGGGGAWWWVGNGGGGGGACVDSEDLKATNNHINEHSYTQTHPHTHL